MSYGSSQHKKSAKSLWNCKESVNNLATKGHQINVQELSGIKDIVMADETAEAGTSQRENGPETFIRISEGCWKAAEKR